MLVGHVVAHVHDDLRTELGAQRGHGVALARVEHRDLHDVLAVQHVRAEPGADLERLVLGEPGHVVLGEPCVHDDGRGLRLDPHAVPATRDGGHLGAERHEQVRHGVVELHHVAVEPERGDAGTFRTVAADQERADGWLCERVQVAQRPTGHERGVHPRRGGQRHEPDEGGRRAGQCPGRRRIVDERCEGPVEVERDQQGSTSGVDSELAEPCDHRTDLGPGAHAGSSLSHGCSGRGRQ